MLSSVDSNELSFTSRLMACVALITVNRSNDANDPNPPPPSLVKPFTPPPRCEEVKDEVTMDSLLRRSNVPSSDSRSLSSVKSGSGDGRGGG